MGVDHLLSDEQVASAVLQGTRVLLLDSLKGRIGRVRAKWLFSGSKGAGPIAGPLIQAEAQPTYTVYSYCRQDMLVCLLSNGFVTIDWDMIQCTHMSL